MACRRHSFADRVSRIRRRERSQRVVMNSGCIKLQWFMRDSTHIQVRICMQQPTVCIPHSRHRIPGCVSVTGAAWFLSEVFCLSPWIYLCCQAVDVATTRITCCTARDHSLFPGEKTWKIEAAPPAAAPCRPPRDVETHEDLRVGKPESGEGVTVEAINCLLCLLSFVSSCPATVFR